MSDWRFSFIKFWVSVLRTVSNDMADPADAYFAYRLLLGREPEPGGWRNMLEFVRSDRRRETVLEAVLNSKEFRSKFGSSTYASVQTSHFTMWLDTGDPHIAPVIMGGQIYEPHVTTAMQRELTPDSVFVDIGANMGWFTLTAARIARRVIAIEPNVNNIQLLYRSLLANDINNVNVLPYAVSDRPSFLELESVHSNGHVSAVGELGGATLVEARPLDEILPDIDRLDVIKMDIEGHEPVALKGMSHTLAQFRPVIILEFHPAAIRAHAGLEPEVLLESLDEQGYQLAVIQHNGDISTPMSAEGIMSVWEAANREYKMAGNMHIDLMGKPR